MALPALDLNPLQNSGYRTVWQKEFNKRRISLYILESNEPQAIDRAVQSITTLLENNPQLCATFHLNQVRHSVSMNKYLVINGNAACLTDVREAPSGTPDHYIDRYFSRNLLKAPVVCTKGHLLEEELVQFWVQKKGDICPVGNHEIGPLEVDEELQESIKSYAENEKLKVEKQEVERIRTLGDRKSVEKSELIVERFNAINRKLREPDAVALGGGVGKVIIKLGGQAALIKIGERAAVSGLKESSKIVKYIPIVSLLIGVGLAVYRTFKGEYKRALAELASGGVAIVPVWGTAASVAIDVGIFAADMYCLKSDISAQNQCVENYRLEIRGDLNWAHQILGLEKDKNPTQEEIQKAYHKMIALTHPDKLAHYGKEFEKQATTMTLWLNEAKDMIFESRGWVTVRSSQ